MIVQTKYGNKTSTFTCHMFALIG